MAFFMESTFVGLMVFGWQRLSKGQHLAVTWLVALGSNLSALWILVANSFMQDPQGAAFNPATMRMELHSLTQLIFNPDAQSKFVHTSIAGYVTAAIFVAGVSAWYMLKKRHMDLAKRSFRMAALYGVLATIGVITLGDALGFVAAQAQPTKLAAMEGLWKTEPGPMPFNLIAFPDQSLQKNKGEVQVPYMLSLLVTHSVNGSMDGFDVLQKQAAQRVENGIPAVQALQTLSKDPHDAGALAQFDAHEKDLGYGFLVQRYAPDLDKVTPQQVQQAAKDSIPPVAAGVLVVPGDGRVRPADAGVLRAGGALHAAQQGPGQALVPDRGSLDDPDPVPGQRSRLAGRRTGTPTVDGIRHAADLDERVHPQRRLHGVLADRVRAALHDLHRGRDVPDGAQHPAGAAGTRRRHARGPETTADATAGLCNHHP